MNTAVGIILCVALCGLVGYQIYKLVKAIRTRKNKCHKVSDSLGDKEKEENI